MSFNASIKYSAAFISVLVLGGCSGNTASAPTTALPAGSAPGAAAGAPGLARGSSAAVPVVVAQVGVERINDPIEAVGSARANEAVEITSKASNIVTAVHFNDGEQVQKGQLLVELDSAQARADLAEKTATLAESANQYKRGKELLATQALSRSSFDQVEATMKGDEARLAASRAKLEDTVIRAPFSGRAGLRRISVGSLINPGTIITTIDDTSVIKLDFAVPERYLAALRLGSTLNASSVAWPERKFGGRILSVDARVDATTRAVTVRAHLPNPDGALRPGMFLTVTLAGQERTAIVIPEEALVPEQDRQFVYVAEGGRAVKRQVQLGARRPGKVEIQSGLKAGETLVVDGTLRLTDGAQIELHIQPQTG